MQNKKIIPLSVLKSERYDGLFQKNNYFIPLYQRAFAWEESNINQLIDDILEFRNENKDINYYIGTLIVASHENDEKFEVIDGQQRLTVLYLILSVLREKYEKEYNEKEKEELNKIFEDLKKLQYESRTKTANTLKDLCINKEELVKETDSFEKDELIANARKIIINKFNESINNKNISKFIENLKSTIIYLVKVPEKTDLVKYFEIMNSRGEQLELTDILKERLMRKLDNKAERNQFNKVWNACSEMDGYVQLHLERKDREKYFGNDWNSFSFNWEQNESEQTEGKSGKSINEIINEEENSSNENSDNKGKPGKNLEDSDRIIDFPFFLLHVLKIYIAKIKGKGIKPNDLTIDKHGIPKLLFDYKLLDIFNEAIKKSEQKPDEFSKKFIECLLRCRFLFDKYIIKRKGHGNNAGNRDDNDGNWSISTLTLKKGEKDEKEPSYKDEDTKFDNDDEINKCLHEENIMIQSCLRVTYTSPQSMHWITELLYELYEIDEQSIQKRLNTINRLAEGIAKKAICEFLSRENNFSLGTGTPHIVFNYLDYIIWKISKEKNPKTFKEEVFGYCAEVDEVDIKNFNNFNFKFNNSIEHWYPQNPSEGDRMELKDGLEDFGNLCLVSSSINSKFSNSIPQSKAIGFKSIIENGSLKLRLMAMITNKEEPWMQKFENNNGKKGAFLNHHKAMIQLLKKHCGTKDNNIESYD